MEKEERQFEEFLDKLEVATRDSDTFNKMLFNQLSTTLPKLEKIEINCAGTTLSGTYALTILFIGMTVADLEVSESEVICLTNIVKKHIDPHFDMAGCKELINKYAKSINSSKRLCLELINAIAKLDTRLSFDVIYTCAILASVDDIISSSEREFLKYLLS